MVTLKDQPDKPTLLLGSRLSVIPPLTYPPVAVGSDFKGYDLYRVVYQLTRIYGSMKLYQFIISLVSFVVVVGGLMLLAKRSPVQTIDLEGKQFTATTNVDSTNGLDSAQLAPLMKARTIYSFDQGGRDTQHTQLGMLSKDTPFRWALSGQSLKLNKAIYQLKKINNATSSSPTPPCCT